jgi:N-acetylglutamate synthase-like GNAT family acetyltransferase
VIRIRRTTDLELVAKLDRICFPADEPVEFALNRFWWVATRDGIPVAYAGVSAILDSDLLYLCRCGVVPWARGLGLQRRLIQARVRLARKFKLEPITDTQPGNWASANNLIACGFRMYEPGYRWAGDSWCYWRKGE